VLVRFKHSCCMPVRLYNCFTHYKCRLGVVHVPCVAQCTKLSGHRIYRMSSHTFSPV
jgi:hypothetical protein